MEKINTPQVVEEISRRMGAYKKDCAELMEHFANIIAENVQAGRVVSYKEIGVFYPFRSARGQLKIKFRPAKKVAMRIAGGCCNNSSSAE